MCVLERVRVVYESDDVYESGVPSNVLIRAIPPNHTHIVMR